MHTSKQQVGWDKQAGGKEMDTLKGHSAEVYAVCFSPDGTLLASGGRGTEGIVRVWNPSTGEAALVEPNVGNINRVWFLPAAKRLLIAGSVGVVLWDLDARERIEISLPVTVGPSLWAAEISPDKKKLAVDVSAAKVAIFD